jgi:drug/metabolite transporter superfamily protein YnfA
MNAKKKSTITSLVIGLLGAVIYMLFHPFGSFDPTSFGFYWSLFTGLFISFSIDWLSTNSKEKPEE